MRRMTGIVITMAAGLMLAGCSGQAQGTGTPAVASSPSPSTLTMAQAAAAYQRIAGPSTKVCGQLGAATQRMGQGSATAPVPASYHALATKCQTAMRTSLRQISQTAWPPNVEPVAQRLVADYSGLITTLGMLARATTSGEAVSALMRSQNGDAAAQQMRIMLGLPAVPAGQGGQP